MTQPQDLTGVDARHLAALLDVTRAITSSSAHSTAFFILMGRASMSAPDIRRRFFIRLPKTSSRCSRVAV
jgi:hypothetical protein